jgi:hypothetical protein
MEILLLACFGLALGTMVLTQSDEEQPDDAPAPDGEVEVIQEASSSEPYLEISMDTQDRNVDFHEANEETPTLVEAARDVGANTDNAKTLNPPLIQDMDHIFNWDEKGASDSELNVEKLEKSLEGVFAHADPSTATVAGSAEVLEHQSLYVKVDKNSFGEHDSQGFFLLNDSDFIRCSNESRLEFEIDDAIDGFVHVIDAEIRYFHEYFGESTKVSSEVSRTLRFYLLSDSIEAPRINLYPEAVFDLSGNLRLSENAFSSASSFAQVELGSFRIIEFNDTDGGDGAEFLGTEGGLMESNVQLIINDWTPTEIALNREVFSEQRVIINFSGPVLEY